MCAADSHPLHGELHEVPASLGTLLAPKLDVDIPKGCVQQHLAMGGRLCVVDIRHAELAGIQHVGFPSVVVMRFNTLFLEEGQHSTPPP